MGILNCTPDSFSDGGRYASPAQATDAALAMVSAGADIVDVGGESTRPGARPVAAAEECARVLPVIAALRRQTSAAISIDSAKHEVARAALDAGADIVNDVTALRGDPAMGPLVAARGIPVVLMHMQGAPATMQQAPRYADVVREVRDFLLARARQAQEIGIAADRILIDPGFGFGKRLEHNLALLARLEELVAGPYPVLVGLSRKSMIDHALGLPVDARLEASVALAVLAAERGAAVVRVHDVAATVRAVRMAEAVLAVRLPRAPEAECHAS